MSVINLAKEESREYFNSGDQILVWQNRIFAQYKTDRKTYRKLFFYFMLLIISNKILKNNFFEGKRRNEKKRDST